MPKTKKIDVWLDPHHRWGNAMTAEKCAEREGGK